MSRAAGPWRRRVLRWFGIAVVIAVAAAGLLALVAQPLVRPVTMAVPPVDAARLQAHVQRLSVDFFPRHYDQPVQLNAAADDIAAQWRALGVPVREQPFEVEGVRFRNLVARFGADDGPLWVIGAHYDSHGFSDSDAVSPQTHTPGADDNASGVAALIELGGALARDPPVQPVELVAWTLEEPPFFRTRHMGSARHADALKAVGATVELAISIEMIGYFSDAPGSQRYPIAGMQYLYPDRGDFIALVGRFGDFAAMRRAKAVFAGSTGLPVTSINAPALVPGIDFSDHRNYWAHGWPALMITDTAFNRNTAYHNAGDTADRLDYRRMAEVVRGVHAMIRARDRTASLESGK